MIRSSTLALAMILSLMSCNKPDDKRSETPQKEQQQTQAAGEHKRSGLQKITIDSTAVWVEIAQDDMTRTRGLMYRNNMPEDQGMLFIFPYPQKLSFWMKNTYLPLDIAFIDQLGIITDIHQMAPLDTIPRYSSSVPTLYALEVNQGFFAQHSVHVGDTVRMY